MKTGKWFPLLAVLALLLLPAAVVPAMAQNSNKNTIYNKQSTTNSGRATTRPVKPATPAYGKHGISGNPDDMPFSEYMKYKKDTIEARIAQDSQKRSVQTKANVDRIMADSYKDIERQRLAYSGYSGPRRTTAAGGGRGAGSGPAIAPYVYTPSGSGQSSGPFSVFKFNKKK